MYRYGTAQSTKNVIFTIFYYLKKCHQLNIYVEEFLYRYVCCGVISLQCHDSCFGRGFYESI